MTIAAVFSACTKDARKATDVAGKVSRLAASASEQDFFVPISVIDKPVTHASPYGQLSLEPPASTRCKKFKGVLKQELQLYPTDVIERVALERIVLSDRLHLAGKRLWGLADTYSGILYFAIGGERIRDADWAKLIHHEVFHFIDKDKVHVDLSIVVERSSEDDEWSHLNSHSFRYRDDGRDSGTMSPGHSVAGIELGFLTKLSMANAKEDKAELFAMLMSYYNFVEARCEEDEILRRKVTYLKSFLEDFSPNLDSSFWKAVRRHRSGMTSDVRYSVQLATRMAESGNEFNVTAYQQLKVTIDDIQLSTLLRQSREHGGNGSFELAYEGNLAYMVVEGCVVVNEQVVPRLITEIMSRQKCDLPLLLDLSIRPAQFGTSPTLFIDAGPLTSESHR